MEEEKKKEELEEVVPQDTQPTNEESPAVESAEAVEVSEEAPQSERDRFRSRIAADYPDLDMDDEEAYYKAANDRYDELGQFRENTENFRSALDLDSEQAGLFNEMIVEASRQKDFDPVLYLVEHGGLDLDALKDDPDYAKKLGDARKKYLDQISEGEEISKQFEENAPASMEAIDRYCEANGISEEDKQSAIGRMYDIMDNLVVGKMPVDLFGFIVKGANYDADVEEANEAGKLEGRSQKVAQTLRSLEPERVGGRQSSSDSPRPASSIFDLARQAR